MALQQLPEASGICFGEVSELDETFFLGCYKGKEMDGSIPRGPRRHGAKAEKGASSMSMCASAHSFQRSIEMRKASLSG